MNKIKVIDVYEDFIRSFRALQPPSSLSNSPCTVFTATFLSFLASVQVPSMLITSSRSKDCNKSSPRRRCSISGSSRGVFAVVVAGGGAVEVADGAVAVAVPASGDMDARNESSAGTMFLLMLANSA